MPGTREDAEPLPTSFCTTLLGVAGVCVLAQNPGGFHGGLKEDEFIQWQRGGMGSEAGESQERAPRPGLEPVSPSGT